MSKVQEVKDKVVEAVKDVDFVKIENDLRIVVDTVEVLNKGNTSSKADNIQRGVNDARKVLGVFSLVRAAVHTVLSIFKKK